MGLVQLQRKTKMDSRDIQEMPEKVFDGQYLEKIYELQKELLDGYIGIEGLPQYPININSKKSQVLIKDFVGRVIEELAEGYESMLEVVKLTKKNKFFFGDVVLSEIQTTMNHLQNVSEEMADAMHFMVELLIYSNIQPEDIDTYITKVMPSISPNTNVIRRAMNAGIAMLAIDNDDNGAVQGGYVDLIAKMRGVENEFYPECDDVRDWELYQAAHQVNEMAFIARKRDLWDITYHLNIARNFLKNKPWKQSQMMSDETRYQEQIVLAFIKMMGFYALIDITPENLYHIYFKKNRVNLFRQKSNY